MPSKAVPGGDFLPRRGNCRAEEGSLSAPCPAQLLFQPHLSGPCTAHPGPGAPVWACAILSRWLHTATAWTWLKHRPRPVSGHAIECRPLTGSPRPGHAAHRAGRACQPARGQTGLGIAAIITLGTAPPVCLLPGARGPDHLQGSPGRSPHPALDTQGTRFARSHLPAETCGTPRSLPACHWRGLLYKGKASTPTPPHPPPPQAQVAFYAEVWTEVAGPPWSGLPARRWPSVSTPSLESVHGHG